MTLDPAIVGMNDVRELTADELTVVSGGKVDVIKAMGNSSWKPPINERPLPPILGGK